jgi:Cu2+-exporting ATPase
VEETPGRGLKCFLAQGEERFGSAEWCGVDSAGEGSEVWYRRNGMPPVRFRFADAMRADAAETVAALKRDGYGVVLLSGDRTGVVEDTARRTGVDIWRAKLKPADKIAWLDTCAEDGHKVLMVGDGLNDAPALATAHASISPASAADISQRAADFVFQGAKLAPVLEAVATAKRSRSMALQNFAVAAG